MRAVIEGLTRRGAVDLAVEDIHWADAASVELLTIVMELTDRLPLMLLVTCRPETAGEAWTFRFHAERNCPHRLTEVRIAALVSEASQQLTETFEEIQSLPELGQTLLAYGRFKLGDDVAEGRRLIARAREIFARIGAVGWVAEADTAPGPR